MIIFYYWFMGFVLSSCIVLPFLAIKSIKRFFNNASSDIA